ncbi:MAG TPA: oxygen-independent coproporphyrinogen III oxidase [Alcanivoracaceae bacterium]|nr:oxygen-independent coproporphyrinogen III oxidase [Alcanivoracaceae bacterium]
MLQFDRDLLRKYDVRGPRYTSYPTAPQFTEAFTVADYAEKAQQVGQKEAPLSLYVHIPFCNTICFYCGCNKVITANYKRAESYLDFLEIEMELQSEWFGHREITQLHFGGGTPTYLNEADFRRVMTDLRRYFNLSDSPEREFSIEIDPRTVTREKMALLAELGFNRMSLGVQDFDPAVQKAVNRIQSVEQTRAVLEAGRELGFRSTNVDLIYGLPLQTKKSFLQTLNTVIEMKPERLAVYSYAHMPQLFKTQKQIKEEELPSAEEKLDLLELTIDTFTQAGYQYIGMDHFALPTDGLAVALEQGTLQRNFQGYSTHAELDMLSLGVSSIGFLDDTYTQNSRDINEYQTALGEKRLPIMRGSTLTKEDKLRRRVIQDIMCQGVLRFEEIETLFEINFKQHFAKELAAVTELVADELILVDDETLQVTPRGRQFLRNIAMVFDEYLTADGPERYSKAI